MQLLSKPYKTSLNICLTQLTIRSNKESVAAMCGVRTKTLEASRAPHGLPKISLFKPLGFWTKTPPKKSVAAFPFRVVMNISANSGNFNLNWNQITVSCYVNAVA